MTQEEIKEELSDVLLNLGGLSFSNIYSLLEEDSAISFEGEDLIKIACHFAEWQKQKDFEELLKSDMTQFKKCYEKGKADAMKEMKETLQTEYEKGRFDMQQEMMKDAVEGVVHHFPHDELAAVHYNDPKGTPMSIYVSSKGLSAGDRVKIIIVKEKEEK